MDDVYSKPWFDVLGTRPKSIPSQTGMGLMHANTPTHGTLAHVIDLLLRVESLDSVGRYML